MHAPGGWLHLSTPDKHSGADYFGGKLATDLHQTAEFLHGEGEITEVSPEQAYTDGLFGASITKVGAE